MSYYLFSGLWEGSDAVEGGERERNKEKQRGGEKGRGAMIETTFSKERWGRE